MKKWDYEITITGARRTITAKSDRAKNGEPLNRKSVEFVNDAEKHWFRHTILGGIMLKGLSF